MGRWRLCKIRFVNFRQGCLWVQMFTCVATCICLRPLQCTSFFRLEEASALQELRQAEGECERLGEDARANEELATQRGEVCLVIPEPSNVRTSESLSGKSGFAGGGPHVG